MIEDIRLCCTVCDETDIPLTEIFEHFRLFHPEQWELVQEAVRKRLGAQWN